MLAMSFCCDSVQLSPGETPARVDDAVAFLAASHRTSFADDGTAGLVSLSPARSNGRHMTVQQRRTNRDTDIGAAGNGASDNHDGHRTVNTYHHVNDGTASSDTDGGGWIIGGSRRRASTGAQKQYHQDKGMVSSGDKQWPTMVTGQEAASSLSEVQVVVHQSPHRNALHDQQSSEASSKWYSKRLSYATKPSPAAPLDQQAPAVAAGSNAILLAEVLGQKSGFNATSGGKGYYGSAAATMSGSKGFQNDLMDMLGKSMWSVRFLRDVLFLFAV